MSNMQRVSSGPSLTEQVTGMIRAAITSGEMKPGEHYSAVGLSTEMGVSRTPVREALQLLEQEGIVRIEKNRGVRVLQISLDEIVEVFQIRVILEPPAVGRAATVVTEEQLETIHELHRQILDSAAEEDGYGTLQADKDFHLYLLGLAGNARLVATVDELRTVVLTHGLVTIPQARSSQDLADDRRDILAAIEARDASAASRAMREHVLRTARLLITGVCSDTTGMDDGPYLDKLKKLG